MTPYSEDAVVTQVAEQLNLEVIRTRAIRITDPKAIKAAGLMRETPDYRRIRSLLNDGAEVKGAEFGRMEYVLKESGAAEGE